MTYVALIYGIIAGFAMVITYCILVAGSADDELFIAVILACTLFPIAAIIVGIAWPLALLATIIRLAARD